MNAVIRADGSPAFSMASMAVGAVINIILDPVFIFGLKWGIAGAAWATVIGQMASFIISFTYFFRTKTFRLEKRSFIPDFKVFRNAIGLGASSFITQMSIVVISLVCNIMLFKYGEMSVYGSDIPISVISIETKVFTIVINLVVGLILGAQPILGYNYGAKKYDRVKQTYKTVLTVRLIIGIVSTLIFELCLQVIIRIFGTGDALYQEFAERTFRVFLSLVTCTCIIKMTSIFFQAVGKPVKAVVASLTRDIICFVPLVILLPYLFEAKKPQTGVNGILFAAPAADFIAIIVVIALTVSYFKSLDKKDTFITVESENAVIKSSHKGVIITIAREHGSAGKQIGKIVAEKLNIPFYYKEMTALAAQESGLSKEFVADINADAPALLHDLYMSTNVIQQAVVAQDKIIKQIADNGTCVIVGRAADYVLRDYADVVKIFIYAPKSYRIQKVMEMYGDTTTEAKANIKRSDEARAAYYRNISGLTWGNAHNYDLCIDSSVGVEKCANVIYDYVQGIL